MMNCINIIIKKKYFKSLHDEVLEIGWHPDRYWNWCLTEDEKRRCHRVK